MYVHVNKINGKKYVGITSKKNPKERWLKNGKGYESCPAMWRAINKYGWDNFEHIIISRDLTKNEACNLEKLFIKSLHSLVNEHGYNIDHGGSNGSQGRILSEETKRKISENHADISGKNCYWYGKKRPQYTKDKISKNRSGIMTGSSNHASKKVICLNNKEIFETCIEAAKKYHTTRNSISRCCKSYIDHAGNDEYGNLLVWMFYDEYLNSSKEYIEKLIKKEIKKNNQRKVICLNTEEIFENYKIPSSLINLKDSSHIGIACRKGVSCGKDINGNKLYWMYYAEYKNKTKLEKNILHNQYYTGYFLLPKN